MKKPTLQQIATAAKVSVRTITEWKKAGVNIYDPAALQARASQVSGRVEAAEDMGAAKLRKLTAQADREETRAARERGELVPAAGIQAEGQAAGLAVRQAIEKLAIELPPVLAGRTADEVAVILKREFRDTLQRLAESPTAYKLQLNTHE